jgi:hypothetical protein
VLIPFGSFAAVLAWGEFWEVARLFPTPHSLQDSITVVAPYVLMDLLGLAVVIVGLRASTGVTRTRYVVWSILVGITVLVGLYAYFLTPRIVLPP